jgi:putative membrane protein
MSDSSRNVRIAAGHDQPAVRSADVAVARDDSAQVPRRAPYVMMALALIGLAVAFYDSYAIYNGQSLWCPPPINGCNEVAASPYARIFDSPVGYYGVVYYLYMFALAGLLAYDPLARGLRIGAVLYAALGVLFMLYFMVLQFRYIQAFCIYCFISAVTTVLLTVTAVSHLKASRSYAGDARIDRRLAALLTLFFVVMLPLQALAQAQPPTAPQLPQWYGHGPWWMWGDGASWQYWWICPLMILFMIVVFATIFFTLRRSSGDGSHAGDPRWRSASHSALQILSERFARSEIAREEYEEKKAAILSGG